MTAGRTLTQLEHAILDAIRIAGPRTRRDLVRALPSDPRAIRRALTRLAGDGLIVRQQPERDTPAAYHLATAEEED